MYPFKTKKIKQAEQIVQWMLCVPKLKTTSPRFVYYADNWNVLDKIHHFTESGEFEDIIENCPAFGADELHAALDYLDRPEVAEKLRKITAQKPKNQAPSTGALVSARSAGSARLGRTNQALQSGQ
jgi:hypothetical protein